MKAIIIIAGLAGALAFSSVAFAGQGNWAGQGNSTPGGTRFYSNPGRPHAVAVGAQCGTPGTTGAASGAFGAWGKDRNRGIQDPSQHPDRGAGTQHGFNNALICGNPPASAPPN